MKPHEAVARRGAGLDLTLVTLIALAITALNSYWSYLNQTPPGGDDNSHLANSMALFSLMSHTHTRVEAMQQFFLFANHYPPLVFQSTYLFYKIFGTARWVTAASFFPFLWVLGLGAYGTGRFYSGRAVGYACAVASLGSPVILEYSRAYFLDLPAASLLVASFCTLLYTDSFTHRGWSAAFGATMGAGLLTKWIHPIPLGPFLLFALGSMMGRQHGRARANAAVIMLATAAAVMALGLTILNRPLAVNVTEDAFPWLRWGSCMGVCAAVLAGVRGRLSTRWDVSTSVLNLLEATWVAALLAFPWYDTNGARVREKIVLQMGVGVNYAQNLRGYFEDMSVLVYLAPYLLVIGVVVGLYVRRLRLPTLLMIASSAVTVIFASLLPQDPRYLLPIVAFEVPLALVWTGFVPYAAVRGAVLGVVALASAWQASAFLFGFGFVQNRFQPIPQPWRLSSSGELPLYLSAVPMLPHQPGTGNYPYAAILDRLHGDPIWLAVLAEPVDSGALQPRSLSYPAALRGKNLYIIEAGEALERGDKTPHDLRNCDCLLLFWSRLDTRARLLEAAIKAGLLTEDSQPERTFLFSPDFQVELYRIKPTATGNSR